MSDTTSKPSQKDLEQAAGALRIYRDGMTDIECMVWAAAFALGLQRTPLDDRKDGQLIYAAGVATGAVCALRILARTEGQLLEPLTITGAMTFVMGGNREVVEGVAKAYNEMKAETDE